MGSHAIALGMTPSEMDPFFHAFQEYALASCLFSRLNQWGALRTSRTVFLQCMYGSMYAWVRISDTVRNQNYPKLRNYETQFRLGADFGYGPKPKLSETETTKLRNPISSETPVYP